jgi:hypothetical protein
MCVTNRKGYGHAVTVGVRQGTLGKTLEKDDIASS